MRVLIADDDRTSTTILSRKLTHWGFEVLVANDGTVAWDLVNEHNPPLAILDWMMPGIDGLELCRRLRTEAQTRTLPLVALSANAMEADIRRAYDAGFDLYLTKPIDVARLLAEIRRLLDGADQRAA